MTDHIETLRAAAKRLRLGVEGPRIADELDEIVSALAAQGGVNPESADFQSGFAVGRGESEYLCGLLKDPKCDRCGARNAAEAETMCAPTGDGECPGSQWPLERLWSLSSPPVPVERGEDQQGKDATQQGTNAACVDEVRRNDDGSLDEVVGAGYYHLERMHAGHWSLRLGRHLIGLHSTRTVKATIVENDMPATHVEEGARVTDAWFAKLEELLENYAEARAQTAVGNVTQRWSEMGEIRLQRPAKKKLMDHITAALKHAEKGEG